MGCLLSTPGEASPLRRAGSIGEVAVFVPGFRIPVSVDLSQPLGDCLSRGLLDRLSILRTRMVNMAAQEARRRFTKPRRITTTRHGLKDLPLDLEEEVLRALCLQALGQGYVGNLCEYVYRLSTTWQSFLVQMAGLKSINFLLSGNMLKQRNPPLWGSMKYLSEKIPKDASSKIRINQDLYSEESMLNVYVCRTFKTAPTLPDFALALKPDDYQLPPLDPLWNKEDHHH
ncbi:hypothetical protein BHE74_00005623 [Ensete ventricosum]|nr:hypothetical protein GW17_00007765 [Ensete ventricosum]RWW85669.1 hypothetical protein BHE74_00005623 [Ensete ventricosum]RZR80357.1 hypothetical protein BHM03_00006383 [Ensete ventricosum]